MKIIQYIRFFILWCILSKKERNLLCSIINSNIEYSIQNYGMAMGETYSEFIYELRQFGNFLKK